MPGTVHIIAQTGPHQSAIIVGDAAGLTVIRDAINRALAGNWAKGATFANDGEGYSVIVLRPQQLGDIPFGYTDEAFGAGNVWSEWFKRAVGAVDRGEGPA